MWARWYQKTGDSIVPTNSGPATGIPVSPTLNRDTVRSSVDMNAHGEFVVTWYGDTGYNSRRFNLAGQQLDGVTLLSRSGSQNSRFDPVGSTIDAAGNFAVIWREKAADRSTVLMQRFARMSPQKSILNVPVEGQQFLVSNADDPYPHGAAIVRRADGSYVVSWKTNGSDSPNATKVLAQIYNADGKALLPAPIQVNTGGAGGPYATAIAADKDGNFVVTWVSFWMDGSAYGIAARRFNADGTPRDAQEFVVNNINGIFNQINPSVAMNANGQFVIAWQSDHLKFQPPGNGRMGIWARRFTMSGGPQGDEFEWQYRADFDNTSPAVAIDSAGNFAVASTNSGLDGNGNGVYVHDVFKGAEIFNPWHRAGMVNSTTTRNQDHQRIAVSDDGRLVVVWQSQGQDGSGYGIYGRILGMDGTWLTDEFRINTTTLNDQVNPNISMDASGNFVVTWESFDGHSWGVFGQQFTAHGTPLGGEIPIRTTGTRNTLSAGEDRPAVALASDGSDFMVVSNQYWSRYIFANRINASTNPFTVVNHYDPAADFSITNGNSNGVWTYGSMTTEFTNFARLNNSLIAPQGYPEWRAGPSTLPSIWLNTTSSTLFGVNPGQLALHPGPGTEPAVLRWTAPADGLYDIRGQVFAGDSGTMLVGIRKGNKWLWQATDAGAFHLVGSIAAGETIDFLVYGGYGFGTTPLSVDVSLASQLAK